VTIAVSYSGGS